MQIYANRWEICLRMRYNLRGLRERDLGRVNIVNIVLNLIFERFIGVFSLVFSANQKIVNLLHCWEDEEGMRTFTG